jgi:hypothetical protein
MVQVVLCRSAHIASSPEVRGLEQAGWTVRVPASAANADVLLPARGGSLAFCLWHEATGTTELLERAVAAARASRRCSILWVCKEGSSDAAADALQAACPPGVDVLLCESSQSASQHIITCAGGAVAPRKSDGVDGDEVAHAAGEVASRLASLWGADTHDVQFLLATRSMSSLAQITTRDEWHHLIGATEGMVAPELLSRVVEWLHRDGAHVLD